MKTYSFITNVYEDEVDLSGLDFSNIEYKRPDDERVATTFFIKNNIIDDYKDLQDRLNKSISNFLDNIRFQKAEIVASWFQKYQQNDFHAVHRHNMGPTDWSMVVFIKADKDVSRLVIMAPGSPLIENESIFITPETGKVIFFPGHLLHYVEPMTNNNDRVILSSNLVIE